MVIIIICTTFLLNEAECMIQNRDRTSADFIIDFPTLLIFSLPTSSTLWKHVTNNQGKLWWWLGSQKNEQALIQRSLKLLVHANSHRWTQRSFSLSILMICSNDLSRILSFMPRMTIILIIIRVKKSHHRPRPEVNISSYPGTRVPGLFFHSRAVIFKSGCFVQKYWSGTVTRKTVIQRAEDY